MKNKKISNTIKYSCTIKYIRNPHYFVFTNENQKIGYELIFDFPFKKKDVFEEAYKILADKHCSGNISTSKKMFNIVSLTKHCYPVVTITKKI